MYNGELLDLFDIVFDNPRLFSQAVENAIMLLDSYDYDYTVAERRRVELDQITAMQWEVIQASLPPSKATLFDRAVAKIQGDLLWANIQPNDLAPIVFWQDVFDPFVSFLRRRGRATMIEVLQTNSDELKEAEFTPDFIDKIITAISEWAERLLDPETLISKEVKGAADVADDVLAFLFSNDDGEEGEAEDE